MGQGTSGRGEEPAGQAPPLATDQSTAESRAHTSITAQAQAATAGLPPTSGQAQRLPIAPLQSEANRRGHFPYRSEATTGAAAPESACVFRLGTRGGASVRGRRAPPPGACALAERCSRRAFRTSRGVPCSRALALVRWCKERVKETSSKLPGTASNQGLKEPT